MSWRGWFSGDDIQGLWIEFEMSLLLVLFREGFGRKGLDEFKELVFVDRLGTRLFQLLDLGHSWIPSHDCIVESLCHRLDDLSVDHQHH